MTMASNLPMEYRFNFGVAVNQAGQWTHVYIQARAVSPGYFSTLGIPTVSGRALSNNNTAGRQRVAVVNESFARRCCNGEGAIGAAISYGGEAVPASAGLGGPGHDRGHRGRHARPRPRPADAADGLRAAGADARPAHHGGQWILPNGLDSEERRAAVTRRDSASGVGGRSERASHRSRTDVGAHSGLHRPADVHVDADRYLRRHCPAAGGRRTLRCRCIHGDTADAPRSACGWRWEPRAATCWG